MFTSSAKYYDKIYSFKNYEEEAGKIREVILREHPAAKTVLDVACGTAEHARFLSRDFQIDGVDLDENLLEIAKGKNPAGSYFLANMKELNLGKKYDVIICLFSSIGYLKKSEEVVQALKAFKAHLNAGGVIFVEPWFTPEVWKPRNLDMVSVDEPDIKICRMGVSDREENNISKLRLEYLIATKDGIEHLKEEHTLALYTVDEMKTFFKEAGLSVRHEVPGLMGRGLYIAKN